MPISSIILQPATSQIMAAYRPVVLRVRATATDGGAIPPVVYCDVYINSVFYRTISKTQYFNNAGAATDFHFDVQEQCQEVLIRQIGPNGGDDIITTSGLFLTVFCRFRSSGIDPLTGFILPEGIIPLQGTGTIAPISGTGTQSNTFFVLNTTIQHEGNQNLQTHLASYRGAGIWASDAVPLTYRTDNYRVCQLTSDYYPIFRTGAAPNCVRIHYKLKNETTYSILSACGSGGGCNAVDIIGSPALPDGTVGVPYSYSFQLSGDTPFSLGSIVRPAWLNISVSGSTVTFSGTPNVAGTNIQVSFFIINCGGSVPFSNLIDISSACVNVTLMGPAGLPNAIVGQPYDETVVVNGTPPISFSGAVTKPAWMNIAISGNNINFTGTPTSIATGSAVSFTLSNCGGVGTVPWATTIDVDPATADLTISYNRFSTAFNISLSHSLDADIECALVFADGWNETGCPSGLADASAQSNSFGNPWTVPAGSTGDSRAPDSTTGDWGVVNFVTTYNVNINGAPHIDGDIITVGSYQVTIHIQECE